MNHAPMRILAIDGGGVRGIIPAAILQALQKRLSSPLNEYFDLIVGVSTGAILAYSISAPSGDSNKAENQALFQMKDVIDLYRGKSSLIFDSIIPRFLNYGLTSAKYTNEGIEEVLKIAFGDITIAQCLTPTISVSYCTEHRRPIFFKSRLAKIASHRDVKIWQACRASSAAPIYFSPFRLNVYPPNSASVSFSLIDGGVVCNNPSMIGIIESLKLDKKRPINLLSLGTGQVKKPKSYDSINNGGLKDWGADIVDILMSGPEDVVGQAVSALLSSVSGSQYLRVQMDIPSELEQMDNYESVELLFQYATRYIKENRSILDDMVKIIAK